MRPSLLLRLLAGAAALSIATATWILLENQFTGVAMDTKGVKVVACTQSLGVWVSSNGGNNYTQSNAIYKGAGYEWQYPSMSADGSTLAAFYGWSSNGALYVSRDSGMNWQETPLDVANAYMWEMAAAQLSPSASHILTVPFLETAGTGDIHAVIYLSSTLDFKTPVPVAAGQAFSEKWIGNSVTCTTSGSNSAATIFAFVVNANVYVITIPAGAPPSYTITKSATMGQMAGPIAADATGKVIACASYSSSFVTGISLSTDSGATFSPLSKFPSSMGSQLTGMSISANGQIIVGYSPNNLFVSQDAGASWVTKAVNAANAGGSLAMSATGGLLAIALQGGAMLLSDDLGTTLRPRGVPVPQPTPYPSREPTPAHPSPAPSPQPTLAPTSNPTNPTAAPTFRPSAPTKGPTYSPTAPSPAPSTPPPTVTVTPRPTPVCVCPYSFTGSASPSVCQQCVQAASCCTYCPNQPSQLCQTTSSSYSCSDAITSVDACSGGTGSGESGSSSSLSHSISLSSPKGKTVAISVSCAIFVLAILVYLLRYWRWRRALLQTQQAQGQGQGQGQWQWPGQGQGPVPASQGQGQGQWQGQGQGQWQGQGQGQWQGQQDIIPSASLSPVHGAATSSPFFAASAPTHTAHNNSAEPPFSHY